MLDNEYPLWLRAEIAIFYCLEELRRGLLCYFQCSAVLYLKVAGISVCLDNEK